MIICCHQQFIQCGVCSICQLCEHFTSICYKQESKPMMDAISQSVCSQSRKDPPSKPHNCILHLHKYMYICTYIRTYLLTPWSTVLLENVTGFQLVKKFFGTQRFITALTSACMYVHMYVGTYVFL